MPREVWILRGAPASASAAAAAARVSCCELLRAGEGREGAWERGRGEGIKLSCPSRLLFHSSAKKKNETKHNSIAALLFLTATIEISVFFFFENLVQSQFSVNHYLGQLPRRRLIGKSSS